jgi:hypothetical protein
MIMLREPVEPVSLIQGTALALEAQQLALDHDAWTETVDPGSQTVTE